jgi:hypothetical protein
MTEIIRIASYKGNGFISEVIEFKNKDLFTKKGKFKEPIAYYLNKMIENPLVYKITINKDKCQN